jgi:hypothetical protein
MRLDGVAILPGSRRGRERSAQRRQRRQRMQEVAERMERAEQSGPYDTRPDPEWWDDYYGEDMEP